MAGLKEGAATRRVFADIVTANYFETFGVTLPLGRAFTAEEERPGANIPVVVLSHGVWNRLGQPADIIGREVEVNLRSFTVVGVAPAGFGGSMVLASPEIWVPTGVYETLAFEQQNAGRGTPLSNPALRDLILVARLPASVTSEKLSAPLAALSNQLSESDPATHREHELSVAPLSRLSVGTRPQADDALAGVAAMLISLASVVLLIASFNLANMLLARGQARRKELAIRLAVGGSRGRIIRQLLVENLVLAALGGSGGVLLSWWATRYIFAAMPPALPISLSFVASPDARVAAAAVAFALLAALVSGLGPAWNLARTDALPELKDQSGEITGRRATWLRGLNSRDALVMAQLAMTFVMLTVAGLFVRGALEAARSDPGFTMDRGLILNVDTSLAGYDKTRSYAYHTAALAALRRTPGVAAAALATHMPFGEFQTSSSVQLPGPVVPLDAPDRQSRVAGATTVSVSSRYFDAIGIALRAGRDFSDLESFATGGPSIAIIDETLARRLFNDADPIGREVQTVVDDVPIVHQVVGVVTGVRPDLFSEGPEPFIYFPFGKRYGSNVYLHAKTAAATADAETALLASVGRMVSRVDPAVTFVAIETRPMFRERNLLLALMRTGAWVFASFGAGALLLAAVGVYGVKSYLVSRRTREIGIRMALGANSGDVVGMVVREGLLLTGVGLLAGVGLSIMTGTLMRGWLFQGRALDAPVIALAAVTLIGAMAIASWVPARRATRVAPATAIRTQ